MTFLRPAVLTVTAALALAGCGGSGSDSIATPGSSVSSASQPQLGAFSAGASVTYYRPDGSVLATGTTDSSGRATVDLGSYTGPFVVRVAGAAGVTYYDEADGTNKPFGSGAALLALVKGSAGGANSVGVTPLTHAAAMLAGVNSMPPMLGSRTAADIDTANGQVAMMFGLPTTFDITKPPTPVMAGSTSLSGSSDANTYAAVLAALAIHAKVGGIDPAAGASALATLYGGTAAGQTNATLAALLANVQTLLSGGSVGGITLASKLTLSGDVVAKLAQIATSVVVSGRVPMPTEVADRITPAPCQPAPTGATGGTGGTGGTGAAGGSSLGSVQAVNCPN